MAEAAHFFAVIASGETNPTLKSQAMAKRAEALFLGRDIGRANPALELAAAALRGVGEAGEARRLEVKRIEGLIEGSDAPLEELFGRLNALRAEAERATDWEAVALALDVELQIRHASGDIVTIQRIFSDMEAVSAEGSLEARAVCSMGLAMQVLFGDAARGLAAAHEAVSLTRHVTAHRLKALLRTMAALQLRGRLALPESRAIVEEARSLASAGGDVRLRFGIESNLAVAYLDSGELDRAETMLGRSTLLLGNAEMRLPRFNQANNHAELALARGDYGTAIKWFGTAEHHLGLATPPYAKQVVSAGLGLCALELGDLAEARRREEMIEGLSPPFYYDPSTLVAFRVRLLERRSERESAMAVLKDTTEALKDRLELAWLKINKLRLEKQIKWQSLGGAVDVAMECRESAAMLGLVRREREFHQFIQTLSSTTAGH
jgi:tetratricopeptide (TPR) repeat protein